MDEQRPARIAAPDEVLLVDDEQGILDVLGDVLRDEGYVPVEFRDGVGALTYLASHEPGLVITDLRLPSMSGQVFIEQLRTSCGPALPVVVMSGAVTSDALRNLPIQAVLIKPFELDAFAMLIHRLAPLKSLD